MLAGEQPGAISPPAPQAQTPQAEPEEEGALDEFLELVARACAPEAAPGLSEQLHDATRAMAADPDNPTELRALAAVLNRILSGERQPDLSASIPASRAGDAEGDVKLV